MDYGKETAERKEPNPGVGNTALTDLCAPLAQQCSGSYNSGRERTVTELLNHVRPYLLLVFLGRTRWIEFAKQDSFFSRAEANASQVPAEW